MRTLLLLLVSACLHDQYTCEQDSDCDLGDAGRQLAAMVEGKVKEVMAREQRQGGILWRMQHA